MPVCIVEGCATTSKRKTDDIMLHSFPKDKELIRRWLQQMHQDFGDLEEFAEKVFTSTRGNYRMCSLHFARSAYEIRGLTTFLRRDAVPTLFPEPVTIQLPGKVLSSSVFSSELHTVRARSTTSMHQPIRQIVVGLCHQEPSVKPQIHIKTEDKSSSDAFETSDLNCGHSPTMSPKTYIKSEDETSSRDILTNKCHIAPSLHEQAIAHQIHIKTEDVTTNSFLRSGMHTSTVPSTIGQREPVLPSQIKTFTVYSEDKIHESQIPSIRSQGFVPAVSRKRPYTLQNNKTVGTMTEYVPGKVHKSIQFDKTMGTNDKGFQVNLRPFHSSVGIQCNLVNLPSLQTLAPRQIEASKKSKGTSRTLHTDLR